MHCNNIPVREMPDKRGRIDTDSAVTPCFRLSRAARIKRQWNQDKKQLVVCPI
jgi:hypothetical protein